MNDVPEKAPSEGRGLNADINALSLGKPCTAFHELAMELAERGDELGRDGVGEGARAAQSDFLAAAAAEMTAGLLASREPSRSILLRSAAWLAVQGGQPAWAMIIARIGLREAGPAGDAPPSKVAEELREVAAVARAGEQRALLAALAAERAAREADPSTCAGCSYPRWGCGCISFTPKAAR